MLVWIWLAGPALAAAVLAILTRVRWERAYLLFGAGVVPALGYVLVVYLHAPHDYAHSQGDEDGRMLWGRWWEPEWSAVVAIVGYLFWALGTAAGLLIRGTADMLVTRRSAAR